MQIPSECKYISARHDSISHSLPSFKLILVCESPSYGLESHVRWASPALRRELVHKAKGRAQLRGVLEKTHKVLGVLRLAALL